MLHRAHMAALHALLLLAFGCGIDAELAPAADSATLRAARQFAARLDYVAGDYGLAMVGGVVQDRREYEEQLELLDDAAQIGRQLPELEAKDEVERIISMVTTRAEPADVAIEATKLANRALSVHGVTLAPLGDPDADRAAALFRENCSKCHGATGSGDGPEAAELKIKPRSFQDPAVMDLMSPRRVFNALTDGIPRAEMPQFDLLAADDRWSLSFYVMTLRFADAELTPASRVSIVALANRSDAILRAQLGSQSALAWARRVLAFEPTTGPLTDAQQALALSISDHRAGRRSEAATRINAILADSFSAYRPALMARGGALPHRIENGLYQLRAEIPGGASPNLEQRALAIRADLRTAQRLSRQIHPLALAGAATLAALAWTIVLLFVGIEAARLSKLSKAARAIHIGYAVAFASGLATLFTGSVGELSEASSRHQVVGVLRVFAVIALLGAIVVLVRRLALVSERPQANGPLPWWLAGLAFACTYGSVLEWSHHISHVSSETQTSPLLLGAAGAVAVIALVAMLRLLLELVRRAGLAANAGVAAIVGFFVAIALIGSAARGLIDGGTLPARALGSVRVELFAIHPLQPVGVGQLAVAGACFLIVVWALAVQQTSRR